MGFLSGLSSAFGMAGALLGQNGAKEQNKQNQAFAQQQWQQNYNAQKEFAQNGLRWKVEDAKKAGLHPLAALGFNGASYSPVNTQSYFENEQAGLGNALSNMGQDISRAVGAKQTARERAVADLQNQQLFDLDVRQKEADIALTQAKTSAVVSANQQQVPAMPSGMDDGQLIMGQAGSSIFNTGRTEEDIVKVPSSYGSGVVQAGVQPMYTLYGSNDKVHVYPNKDLMDYISEGRESKAYFYTAIADDFANGRISLPPAKPGFKWQFQPLSLTFRQVPVKSKKTTVYESMYGY